MKKKAKPTRISIMKVFFIVAAAAVVVVF